MRDWYKRTFDGSTEPADGRVPEKKIVVHVGANKTGSSAIQRFLALNALALRSEGIIVPDKDFKATGSVQGHQVFSFQELMTGPPEDRRRLKVALEDICTAYPEATKTILLSAENLTANPVGPSLFEDLMDDYDVRIIMYIRRQDEFILSSWQQWHSKIQGDFWAWLVSVVGTLGNWQAHLQNWESVFPREKIEVRTFERSTLVNGDVVADFHEFLGIEAPYDSFKFPKRSVNPSFSDAVMDLVKGNELIFENTHDNDFYRVVAELTGDRFKKSSRQSSITMAQRRAILACYDRQNAWVREKYFPDRTGGLFSPLADGDYDYVSEEELDREKLEFLTTMMYRIYKQRGS